MNTKLAKLFFFLFFYHSVVAQAIAQTIPGYDVLGLAMYCNRFLEAPPLPAMGVLLNTFGNPLPCTEKRIQRGGVKVVQVDLIDATCWRNKVCPPGVPKPTNFKEITKRARTVSVLAERYPAVDFWLSPGLEHDEKNPKTVQQMMDAAKAGCPKCRIINSPFMGARLNPLELHGTKVKAFSVSGDGASIFDADNSHSDGNGFEHRTAGIYTTFAWWNELNLRCTGEKKFTAPKKRTEKPTADQFRQAYMLMQPEPQKPTNMPKVCKSVREVEGKKGEIYKPNAESYCNGQVKDSRGNKPLFIIRKAGKKGQTLNVHRPEGPKVGCIRYYGNFETPGTHRWYMGNCSGQTPVKLADALGGEWGYVHLGGGQCLRFNAIRRAGTYR